MKNTGVLLARSLAYIDVNRLDPKGGIFYPDLIKEISREFSFQKTPQQTEWEEKKGLEFRLGKTKELVIDALKIFDTLVVVETHSNTADSEKITSEILQWTKEKFGVTFTPDMIRSWGYVSDVVFETDFPLMEMACNPLTRLGAKTSAALTNIWHEEFDYKPINLIAGHDPLVRKNGIAPFSIQLRADSHFEDYRWFSEAPLPTDLHFKLLQEFEADVLASAK